MVTTLIAPKPVHIEKPFATPGVMFASEIQELEARLPRLVLNALEAVSRQMETEIFEPILRTPGIEQLKEEFERAFKRYANLYISLSFLLLSEMDIASLPSIWMAGVARLKAELESRGNETIGEEATNDMLVGLAAVGLVNQKLFELSQAGYEAGDLKELQGWTIAYWLASSCVYCYHFDRKGNLQNVKVLAYWSHHYAADIYRCAKNLGLLEGLSKDDSDELELMLNRNFISAMGKIVQGLEESDIKWDKVKKVVPKF